MIIRKFFSVITIISFTFMMSGCCTIMQGTSANIGISSSPTGATVIVNNVNRGKTPLIVDLKRKDNHIIRIELNGYAPYETTITRSVSGWVWGNILFGGLIGLAVDAISGGLYKLTPDQVEATLQKEGISQLYRENKLYIAVVLEPDPNWEKIGQLQSIN